MTADSSRFFGRESTDYLPVGVPPPVGGGGLGAEVGELQPTTLTVNATAINSASNFFTATHPFV